MHPSLAQLKADLESSIGGMSVEQLRRHLPGKWSASEVLEHLYLTYTGTIRGLEKALAEGRPLATRASLKQRLATLLVVGYGHMPGGRTSPSVARPRGMDEEAVRSRIGGAIEAMDALIAQCEARFGRVKLLDHPILGPLSAGQWRRFHCVHGRHHHRQLIGLRERATAV
jgi:hypothetical protein